MSAPGYLAAAQRSLFLLAMALAGCELGGGESEHSVTVPGEDGVFTKAEASAAGTAAKLELERSTRKVIGAGEVRYIFDKSLTEQFLRLYVADASDDTTFIVSEHDEASSFESHGLEVAPEGSRVAYRLGTRPWHVIYVLTPNLAVHDPREHPHPLDWAQVDDIETAFLRVYDAQDLRLDGLYSFNKMAPMMRWLRDARGDEVVVGKLMEMLGNSEPYYEWDDHAALLSTDGKDMLAERLRSQVRTGMGNAKHYREVWALGVMDLNDPANLPVVKAGVIHLVASEDTLANKGEALAAFLDGLAKLSPEDARPIACELLSRADPPYALQEDRPARLSAEAACK